jgi:uncharacterized NAD(P)/FAD-binding protein YdhS
MRQRSDDRRQVVVIGGGFSGSFFAAQLAAHTNVPLHIAVIEPRPALGGGVAYSTRDLAHRVNVPAARMTLYPDNPTDFDDWVRGSGELAADPEALWDDGSAYPRRAAFGRYVAEIVASRAAARPGVSIEHVRDEAGAVRRTADGYAVERAQGTPLHADIVVLATSHPPPAAPRRIAEALGHDARLVSNPWHPDALDGIDLKDDVAIIGTGLSMADVVASLDQRGHLGKITAFSRRGLLPRGHAPAQAFTCFAGNITPDTALALSRLVRRMVAEAAGNGVPWQAVFDDLRGNGQKIWSRLDAAERRRFLRHLRVFWDSHRYRIAPQIEAVLRRKMHDGTLAVLAASLAETRPGPNKIVLAIHPRRKPAAYREQLLVNRVIVTTGPAHGSMVEQLPVLHSLARQGLLQPDPLGLGVLVDGHGQVIATNGIAAATLLVAGPLAREQYGELMGMPQVSAQANEVATRVASVLRDMNVRELVSRG